LRTALTQRQIGSGDRGFAFTDAIHILKETLGCQLDFRKTPSFYLSCVTIYLIIKISPIFSMLLKHPTLRHFVPEFGCQDHEAGLRFHFNLMSYRLVVADIVEAG
jgi:hypothetical protein